MFPNLTGNSLPKAGALHFFRLAMALVLGVRVVVWSIGPMFHF